MALLISYRGNTSQIVPEQENKLEHIQNALNKGFHVMVDIWLVGTNNLATGTTRAQYPIDINFIRENNIICHAMTSNTMNFLLEKGLHCFMWDREKYSLTNGGLIWSSVDPQVNSRTILVLPERNIPHLSVLANLKCAGICSSRIQEIKDERDKFYDHK